MREWLIHRLRRHVYKDSLTGLENRRYFYIKINRELSSAKLSKNSLSFLMIDIDNFKVINDTYGHIVEDKVLKRMAAIFK